MRYRETYEITDKKEGAGAFAPAFHMKKILLKVKQLTIYWEEPCLSKV